MKTLASQYLAEQKNVIKELVNRLSKKFQFVSVLGVDTKGNQIRVSRTGVNIEDSMWSDRGFVVRVYHDQMYSEYAFNEISGSQLDTIENEIISKTKITIQDNPFVKLTNYALLEEEKITASFVKNELQLQEELEPKEVVESLIKIKDDALKTSEHVVNINLRVEYVNINKIYISNNKDLEQSYTWGNASIVPIVRKGHVTKYFHEGISDMFPKNLIKKMESAYKDAIQQAIILLDAKKVESGVYDVICTPEITGLIAHEAFGHGVEMDMFVKNRAKAMDYLDKQVASELVIMHDGAAAWEEVSSYAFDDEGTLASDTIIINNGILKTGISDVLSAMVLGTKPTGNGKRQSYDRKAYSRMTNTFFEAGKDKVEDMIKSINRGYLISGMMSGMEDPKNWGIQCVAMIGQEIVDGKLTDNFISPVIMTGYVPDLLQSITMVSDTVEMYGTGMCGKGHKEFVKASDGGPYIKARVRLG